MQPGEASLAASAFPWLLLQKVAIPDPVRGYVDRPELVARANPTQRRLTILNATGGFGKTTLMAECCRRLRQEGVATAWIALDERDEPAVLDGYIALACVGAGLNLVDVPDPRQAPTGPESRIGLVVREIQSRGRPFVIAFDELERLRNPGSVALLAYLLQRGPPNLHLVFAGREIPDGLNVAGAVLDGVAETVETEDLRFSTADVARFFDLRLSRDALVEEMDRSAGWPLALRISRGGPRRVQALVGNWLESRLLADLGRDDRDFVLDLGLFGWADAALLDEVLQRTDAERRMESIGALEGLVERVAGGTSWRLHPLVREHCARQRFQEDPERFKAVHRRIAAALARRGETVLAMRHAAEGGAPFLAGEILEEAGGVRLWTLQGVVQLAEADRLLSEDVVSRKPRLQLVRCLVLALSGRQDEAAAVYGQRSSAAEAPDREADLEYRVDDCIVRTGIALYGAAPLGEDWLRTLPADIARVAASPRLDAVTRGHFEYGLCVAHFLRGEFDAALDHLSAAQGQHAGSRYVELYGTLVRGHIAFVEGRPEEARVHYRKARRMARRDFLLDPVAATSCAIAMSELTLECGRAATVAEPPGLRSALMKYGQPFSAFAVGCRVLIDTRLRSGRVDDALATADALLAHVRRARLTTFARPLAAMRISVLVIAGRAEEAERAWRQEGLPEEASDCLDLTVGGWREMEALSEARVRLWIADGRFDEARALVGAVLRLAGEHRLRKVEMRAWVWWILLEQRAGDPEAALRSLTGYLKLFAESPYAWPLVREREGCEALLQRYLDLDVDGSCRPAARSLLAAVRRVATGPNLSLSGREREVLQCLVGRRDKEIAAALGLSVHGVRYHLRSLFRKLGVANRAAAIDRAAALGLVTLDD